MRVLILGGTGTISTAITRQLLARGDEVVHLNRGQTPHPFADAVRVRTVDRNDEAALAAALQAEAGADALIDMVCFHPDQAAALVRALGHKVGHLLFCSTVDVYQRPAAVYPLTEATPYGAASQYGRDKAACEQIFLEAAAQGQLGAVTNLRPASTYAENSGILHPLGWSSAYWDRLRQGLPVLMHGDGTSLWVSAHSEDVARGFLGALDNPEARGRGYHLTGEEWITWREHVRLVAEVMGWPAPRFVCIPTEVLARLRGLGAPALGNWMYPNIFANDAAARDLGYRYTITFREGVARVLAPQVEAGQLKPARDEPFIDEVIVAWEDRMEALHLDLDPVDPSV